MLVVRAAALTDVERRDGGRGRLVGGLDFGGVGVVCRFVREGGGEAEGMYRRDRMAPMDVPLAGCPELGRVCRMEVGGPSGMGPSHRWPRGVILPDGAPDGVNGLVCELLRDACLGCWDVLEAGIPVLKRRDGGPFGVRFCTRGLCGLRVSGLMAGLMAVAEE